MADLTLTVATLTSSRTFGNAKAQAALELALQDWGYPPPNAGTDENGDPIPWVDTPQARLDWALNELVSHIVESAIRAQRDQRGAARAAEDATDRTALELT